MKKGIVDRIEGDVAVCEWSDRSTEEIPLQKFPGHLREGDVFALVNGKIELLPDETKKRRESMKNLFDRLKKK